MTILITGGCGYTGTILTQNLLEKGYTYELKFSFYEDSLSSYREQPYAFKTRVEQDEY